MEINGRVVANTTPAILDLEPGTYYWCRCGRSKQQPFCDGSHHGTGLSPKEFTLTEPKRVALCRCKVTKMEPFCDGSHKALPQ